jgi:hypothetical protein
LQHVSVDKRKMPRRLPKERPTKTAQKWNEEAANSALARLICIHTFDSGNAYLPNVIHV